MDAITLFDANLLGLFRSLVRKVGGGKVVRSGPVLKRFFLLLSTLLFQLKQVRKRSLAARKGAIVPPILIASITRRCNLHCAGCYSRELRAGESKELSDDRFMEIFTEGAGMGVGVFMLAGGEPLLRRDLLERVAALKGPVVPVFTNGTLLDEEYIDLFESSRLVPVFSIEGDTGFTTERRGKGIHEGVIEKAAELKRRGILFGFSITLTSGNADTVLSADFLKEIDTTGAAVLFLVEYVPVTAGTENLVLTEEQKSLLVTPGFFDSYRFSPVLLPGDEEQYGGCLAAGRGFIHIADDGKLEACPFAPYSDCTVTERGLAEALRSPLMKAIREHHNELTETSGGCALWNKGGWVASLTVCAGRGSQEELSEKASVNSGLPGGF